MNDKIIDFDKIPCHWISICIKKGHVCSGCNRHDWRERRPVKCRKGGRIDDKLWQGSYSLNSL